MSCAPAKPAGWEHVETWDQVRDMIGKIAVDRGEWGGLPIPVDHIKLVMEPRFPWPALNGMKVNDTKPAPASDPDVDFKIVNDWFCWQRHAKVYLVETGGKRVVMLDAEAQGRRFLFWMNTVGVACTAWTVAAETRAMEKLKDLVTPHAFKCYALTGSFLETSPRSKVTYLFRKLRPTIALRPDRDQDMQILAVLCLHPLGYYEQSWAGVMTPTDDVISHLVLMRGDEPRFWRKANHHPTWAASAGL